MTKNSKNRFSERKFKAVKFPIDFEPASEQQAKTIGLTPLSLIENKFRWYRD